ncbi:MAG: pyridoxine 5'-phosphate synthase [Verrucomicrobia bacterium]|nr:MAG: pyridoxine 5'-phosphate synthase [Verrucomicrobiota bacterium]
MKNKNILLGVNIDHVATLRQARYKDSPSTYGQMIEPDPLQLALAAERSGADGITLHLREDRRHIQEMDCERIRSTIQTRLNFEMAATDFMIDYVLKIKPHSICLVPESREEITTEGGLDLISQENRIKNVIDAMKKANILVSLFIDPDPKQIKKAAELKAFSVELHTGSYANKYYTPERSNEFDQLCIAADLAHGLGLVVNAGHGINYVNITQIRQIPWLYELNIGHSIISRSLLTGIEESVKTMKSLMQQ